MSRTVETLPSSLERRILAPPSALMDEKVHINPVGFEPFQTVVVRAALHTKGNYRWESHAAFQADAQGSIDVSSQKPQSGTYEEIDPMGLFWSMSPQSAKEIESIAAVGAPPPKGTVRIIAEVDGQVMAWTDIARKGISADVTVTRVSDNGLAGVFFRPVGQGPFPTVFVLGGSGGGIPESFGALLASHGFAVMALAYFRYEHLPKELVNIPLEYFEKAIAWLVSHVDIRRGTLGVVGRSRGGELALVLGATFPEIARVVAYVPSDRVNGGYGNRMWQMVSPFDSSFWATPLISENILGPWRRVPAWLWHGKSLPYSSIPVEKIHGPILLISGKEDKVWPSARMCDQIVKRLEECKHPYPFKHLSYDHAGHAISFPYVPTGITQLAHPVTGTIVRFGGTAAGNAFANEDSWRHVLQFLDSGETHD
jgi:dienelactone hydrolase